MVQGQLVDVRGLLAKSEAANARLRDAIEEVEGKYADALRVNADQAQELEGARAAREGDHELLRDTKASLGATRAELEDFAAEVQTQRSAMQAQAKESKELAREVRSLEERARQLQHRVAEEEDRAADAQRALETERRAVADLGEAVAAREREAQDAGRALVEAQGDLAKLTLRSRSDEQEVARCKHEVESLTLKLQQTASKLEEAGRKNDAECRAKDQARQEARALEEEVFVLRKKLSHMASEVEDAREAQLKAESEEARLASLVRDLRLRGVAVDLHPAPAGGVGGHPAGSRNGGGAMGVREAWGEGVSPAHSRHGKSASRGLSYEESGGSAAWGKVLPGVEHYATGGAARDFAATVERERSIESQRQRAREREREHDRERAGLLTSAWRSPSESYRSGRGMGGGGTGSPPLR